MKTLPGILGPLAVLGVVIVFFVLAKFSASSPEPAGLDNIAATERLAPVGKVTVAETSKVAQGPKDGGDKTAPSAEVSTNKTNPEFVLFGGKETPPADDKGKTLYESACAACHGTGVAGAPKVGDKANWAPRIQQGMETLAKHAIEGFQGSNGMMPPKGGRSDLSDEDVKAAVSYMARASQ
jgi:cytochrome c5